MQDVQDITRLRTSHSQQGNNIVKQTGELWVRSGLRKGRVQQALDASVIAACEGASSLLPRPPWQVGSASADCSRLLARLSNVCLEYCVGAST